MKKYLAHVTDGPTNFNSVFFVRNMKCAINNIKRKHFIEEKIYFIDKKRS